MGGATFDPEQQVSIPQLTFRAPIDSISAFCHFSRPNLSTREILASLS
jgi:hypothetical protein